jgi:hypothetical protein
MTYLIKSFQIFGFYRISVTHKYKACYKGILVGGGNPQLVVMDDRIDRIGEGGDCVGVGLFDTKVTASDNVQRGVNEAERMDLAHLVENSCISCNRLLNKNEIKVVPPRYVQERDQYVKSGAVSRRLMCVNCYNALKTVTRTRMRYRDTASARKSFFVKSIINNILLKQ